MILLADGNPFIHAYLQSDWFGKGVFWSLFFLSFVSWTILIHKTWLFFQIKALSREFSALFSEKEPLQLQFHRQIKKSLLEIPHPFFEIYKGCKQKTLAIFSRNHLFAKESETFLSEADLGLIESEIVTNIAFELQKLDKNLFILSTATTLGPFLGLLGTVWGILMTFSDLHAKGHSLGNANMLSGLSLALATTVIGLVVAIPALIGHNALKNAAKEYRRELETFSEKLLSSIELKYRKPDHAPKTVPIP